MKSTNTLSMCSVLDCLLLLVLTLAVPNIEGMRNSSSFNERSSSSYGWFNSRLKQFFFNISSCYFQLKYSLAFFPNNIDTWVTGSKYKAENENKLKNRVNEVNKQKCSLKLDFPKAVI